MNSPTPDLCCPVQGFCTHPKTAWSAEECAYCGAHPTKCGICGSVEPHDERFPLVGEQS